jgi:eukaryotic-like serine/threonine-protein kinase
MRSRVGERRIIGGRYELSRVAGSGGAGRVYQAVDLPTGSIVAVKLLMDHFGADVDRFAREALLLERLRHDGIVRYLDHGEADDGHPYLVMEWLDGVALSEGLGGDFGLARSIALMKRLGAALAHAHLQGIVHRDIKPSNVFLVGGRAEMAKLVDFGLALGPGASDRITGTGVPVGTPAYMAPEMIQGQRGGTPTSDIFSLGSLFYRCLTGQAPFTGPNVMAVLAKVVVSHPPPVRELRPFTPPSIDRLVMRMLQKEPSDRFADAAAFLAALCEAEARIHEELEHHSSSSSLGVEERRLISVLMADGVASPQEPSELDLASIARKYMSEVQTLGTGQLVFTFGGEGGANDLVGRAARCALEMRSVFPDAVFSVVTGQGDPRRHLPAGDVIDAAVASLGESLKRGSIVLDLTTQNLLEARFVTRNEGSRILLESFHEADEPGKLLLGRSTPFVGRRREVRMALACFEGAIEDRASSVLLVTGQAGIGKSRLREEVVERMRQSAASPQILNGRADAVHGGTYELARRLLCAAAGVRPEFPAVAAQALVRSRLERVMDASLLHEETIFLSELVGAPFDRDVDIDVEVVRSDPQLLGDRIKLAFGRWLAAEARAHPTAVVLEDLDCADRASIELIEAALGEADRLPLFVFALARPTIEERLPGVFRDRRRVELSLGPLPEAAVLELVEAVAHDIDGLDGDTLAERSGGNPLLVEELIRAAASGRANTAPQSVLALLQSRFEELAAPERRAARLASVFGDTFSSDGVLALAGDEGSPCEVQRALDALVEHEIVERAHAPSDAPSSYRFRSGYWREAAYSTFTDADRVNAHRAAGEHLAARGGTPPLELAYHFEQGSDPRACEAYAEAAALALTAGDVKGALAHVDRGVSFLHGGDVLGRLRQIEAEAQRWAGSNELAAEAAHEAIRMLPWGSRCWLYVLGELAAAEGKLGNPASVFSLGDTLESTPHVEGLEGVRAIAAARIAMQMAFSGDPVAASSLLENNAPSEARLDAVARGYILEARAVIAGVRGHRGDRVRLAEQAAACFEAGRDPRNAALLGGSVGFAFNEAGMYERAKIKLKRAIALADSVGAKNAVTVARVQLARAFLLTGERENGQLMMREAIRELIEQKNARLEGVARVYLAESLLDEGGVAEAELQLERAVSLLEAASPLLAPALAVLSRVRMRQGNLEEALRLVDRAADIARTLAIPSGEGMVRYSRIMVLEAAGDLAEARAARERGKAWLAARAAELDDAELAEAFLRIAEHRAILEG